MKKAYILLGGNLGNRKRNIATAVQEIKKLGTITAMSSLYETAAWGKEDQPDFINQVIILETTLLPEVLLEELLSIEHRIGRVRSEKYAPRMIDIDILLVDNLIMNLPHLQIPHPRIQERNFVLIPLAELVPEFHHPVFNQTIATLLQNTPDTLVVKKL